jgi:ABC-type sugar transport system permease subunit
VKSSALARREARLAWRLMAPLLVTLAVGAVAPLAGTLWESLHRHDLRLPWLGRPFIGLGNYTEALADPRFLAALAHTLGFALASVALELVFGLLLALALDALVRGRAVARLIVLLPWALPTVVAALIWRFLFDAESGVVAGEWMSGPLTAWVPIVLGDVWKTTPFVALLMLAGLQGIDASLFEAARLDGAGAWQRFRHVTLPHLRPAIVVALVFRTLDAFRVFDLVFVLTNGGPGTSTEVVSLYAFKALLQDLRFGYGSALAVMVFLVSFALAVVYARSLGVARRRG